MHNYKEQQGDRVSKQFHPNGTLYLYAVLNNDKPANGWSQKIYYPDGALQQEENYSNGMLIEKISYDINGVVTAHKIWNNRTRQLVDKPAVQQLPRPNVVTGYAFVSTYLQQLPAISEFIGAEYDEAAFLQSYKKPGSEDAKWTMRGKQMSFTVYWDHQEVVHQWHCHCDTEELYWKAREVLKSKLGG